MILRYRIFFVFLLFFGGISLKTSANIIHVPGQVSTIKSGISAAMEGDTIMVGPGTYTGFGSRDLDFGGKSIVVRSMKGPTLTILDCQGSSTDNHRGFHAHQGEDSTTIIEGFTIINGYAPYNGPGGTSIGGGILCQNGSSPTIIDCVLYGNYAAGAGGGLACVDSSSPYVIECTFIDNSAIKETIYFVGYGGGIRCESSSPVFRDCIIASNHANIGGGMSCNDAQIILENCEFSNNTADVVVTFEPSSPGVGGGIHFFNSSATLEYSVIDRNMALAGNNMSYESASGGGIACYNSSVTLTNCTIYGNLAEKISDNLPGGGAGIYLSDSPAQIENSIIAYNLGGEGVGCPDACSDTLMIPVFACSDIFGNEFGDWIDSIAAQETINGNISQPPYFCNPTVGNLNLWNHSSCTPDSNECGIQIGARGAGCLTDTDDSDDGAPRLFLLAQNRPNPFNQSTLIEYTLPASSHINITLYNTLGQVVCRLDEGNRPAGSHIISWDGKDANGTDVASGIYFYTIQAGDYHDTKRMVLTK